MGMGKYEMCVRHVHVISQMVRFKDVQALRVQLQNWEGGYADYADILWSQGRIWSIETLAASPLETLSGILASGDKVLPYHSIHAADLVTRAKASGVPTIHLRSPLLVYSLSSSVNTMDSKTNYPYI